MTHVIRMRDVQRRGGPCARYPSSCVIRDLLDEAGLLRPLEPIRIIDVTYGQGIFYYALRAKVVVAGVDIRRLDWVTRPRCFIQSYAQRWRDWLPHAIECLGGPPDLVVADPPWQKAGNGSIGGRRHYYAHLAAGTPESILVAGLELARHLGVPLLYHFREPLGGPHVAGPVFFRHFLCDINKKAKNCLSVFGVVGSDEARA